mmetsp:Transcript_12818/g.36250  ORF Transcript_12818/g.36250 Transcript_12818/m.36250 type:complete len:259 (-) Transcript_12818:643-1419(-)
MRSTVAGETGSIAATAASTVCSTKSSRRTSTAAASSGVRAVLSRACRMGSASARFPSASSDSTSLIASMLASGDPPTTSNVSTTTVQSSAQALTATTFAPGVPDVVNINTELVDGGPYDANNEISTSWRKFARDCAPVSAGENKNSYSMSPGRATKSDTSKSRQVIVVVSYGLGVDGTMVHLPCFGFTGSRMGAVEKIVSAYPSASCSPEPIRTGVTVTLHSSTPSSGTTAGESTNRWEPSSNDDPVSSSMYRKLPPW